MERMHLLIEIVFVDSDRRWDVGGLYMYPVYLVAWISDPEGTFTQRVGSSVGMDTTQRSTTGNKRTAKSTLI